MLDEETSAESSPEGANTAEPSPDDLGVGQARLETALLSVEDLPNDMPTDWEIDSEIDSDETRRIVAFFDWLVEHCGVSAVDMAGQDASASPTDVDVVQVMLDRFAEVAIITTLKQSSDSADARLSALETQAGACPRWRGSADDWDGEVPAADTTVSAVQPLEPPQVGDRSVAMRAVTFHNYSKLLFADQVRWRRGDVLASVTIVWPPVFFAGRGERGGPTETEVESSFAAWLDEIANSVDEALRM